MQRININAVPDGFPQVLYYSQGDIGRQFAINVADFEIPSGAVVKIQATKPSGLGFSVTGTVSGNSVTFTTTAAMTDEAGRYPAELQITSGTTVIGTANITMCGEPNPHPDGTTDGQIGTIVPELTLLVERIEESNARIEEMTASAEALTPGSDPTAEYDSENNELIIGIPTAEVDEEDLMKLYIHKTASGDIATITDGADDVPMKSVKVSIVPKQSGSGDPSPSNVRPITGWDEVEVVRCGKNWLYLPTLEEFEASPKVSNYYSYAIKVKPNTSYYLSVSYTDGYDPSGKYTYVLLTNNPSGNNPWVALAHHSNPLGGAITSSADGYLYLRLNDAEIAHNNYPNIRTHAKAQLEEGTTATSYEPYQGESYPISLPSTVYGGTDEIASGSGKSTMGMVDLGTLDWKKTTNATKTYFQTTAEVADMKKSTSVTDTQGLICSQYVENTWVKVLDAVGYDNLIAEGWGNKSFLVVYDSSKTNMTDAEFKSAMSGVKLVYPLATPTDFNTTPTPINTLLGSNNIYSDSGSVEVVYRADSTLAYNELLEAIANL